MKIEQIYTGCLAQGAYYIVSDNEAVIIDPLRETQPYTSRADIDGVKIKYILETHFHADFVSGHIDLSKVTGAQIVYGPNADPEYPVHIAKDGEILKFGNVSIKVLHTPGHTMESTCYLLLDEKGNEHAIFTGDTLFIGDVGRPDLAQKSADLTMEQLAETLYHSLRNKIMTLHDDVIVYPAHGAGSACGKHMSKETVSTIGAQKATNYALRADMTEVEFVKEVTDGLMPPPGYFGMNVHLNKSGYDNIDDVMKRGLTSLNPEQFEMLANDTNAIILDTRNAEEFSKGFIPNSINIGLDGQFAPWVGAMLPDVKQEILIIADNGREEETVSRLARVGYDYVLGYMEGGFQSWSNENRELNTVERRDASDVNNFILQGFRVIDVRKPAEFQAEHVLDAMNIPLDFINESMAEFPKNEDFVLHCAGGYRSMIAASILKSRGFDNFIEIRGGFNAILKSDVKTTQFICPTSGKS
jgi:glyoxylase-like metal-dependent hydrolase (beta-lactamase superfamily II)/rhodanese-related sulfurtransferase